MNGNRSFTRTSQGVGPCKDLSSVSIVDGCNARNLLSHYSEETAAKNIKALAHSSMDLFHLLADIFLDSPHEHGTSLKVRYLISGHYLWNLKLLHTHQPSLFASLL